MIFCEKMMQTEKVAMSKGCVRNSVIRRWFAACKRKNIPVFEKPKRSLLVSLPRNEGLLPIRKQAAFIVGPWLPYAQRAADAQRRGARNAVELAEPRNGRAVTHRDAAQRVARTDPVVLRRSERFARLLGSLFVVGFGLLVFEVLRGARMDIQIALFEQEGFAPQVAALEVDQSFGVERLSAIARLEVEMRAGAASRAAAVADDLPRLDPFVGVDDPLREVAVESFQSVVVADDDQVAVAAGFGRRDRDAHLAVEGGVDRVARFQRQVYALMLAPAAHTELRTDGGLVGIVVAFERVDQLDVHRTRQVGELHHVAVGKEFGRVPAAGVDFAVLDVVAVAEVFPCVVVEQDDHHCVVARKGACRRRSPRRRIRSIRPAAALSAV